MLREKRNLIIGLVLLVLTFIGILVVLSGSPHNVEVSTSPRRTTIEYNGKKISSSSTAKLNLKKGKYTLKITAENFSDRSVEIEVKDSGEVERFGFLLYPTNDRGRNVLTTPRESEWRDMVGQLEAQNVTDSLFGKYPLFSYLPKVSAFYRVDYALASDGSNAYKVWITANSAQQEAEARKWISSVDSTNIYDIGVRSYSSLPSSQGDASESWEPIGRDTSDPALNPVAGQDVYESVDTPL